MFNFFKKKETDIHELGDVKIRSAIDSYEESDEEEYEEGDGIGVLIQFTPISTYLYINHDGFNCSDELNGYFEMRDLDGNSIDVFGNVISTRIDSMSDLPKLISKYHLEHPTIPLVKIEVKHFE